MIPNYNPYMNYNYNPVPVAVPNISGRVVSDFAEITANDVPMTGNFAYFPKSDMSEIQVRRWNNNGQINTFSFVPAPVKPAVEQEASISTPSDTEALIQAVSNKLDRIEKIIKRGTSHERNADNAKPSNEQLADEE